jgi:hypothetical protein
METKQGKKESPRTGGWISALKFLPLVVFAALVIVFKLELLLAAPIATFVSIMTVDERLRPQFPSPRGDKLCLHRIRNHRPSPRRFRPLAGISCVIRFSGAGPGPAPFPSPRGDKLCLQNCPTGACGIGPGSDRITISHSTATGKWQLEIKIPLIFLREPLQTAMQVAAMETRFAQSADSH